MLALEATLEDPSLAVEVLVTTVTAEYDRISMHGVRRELLERQADALGLPLVIATVPARCTNAVYEAAVAAALGPIRAAGVTVAVCGDLFLADIREYRERQLAEQGLEAVFPLWGQDTRELAHRFIDLGHVATLCCVDPGQIDPSFAGRRFDRDLLRDLPHSADPCGENGEFHTFVSAGPLFGAVLDVSVGAAVQRDGFCFRELSPE